MLNSRIQGTPRRPKILLPQQQKRLLELLSDQKNQRTHMLIFLILKTGLKSSEVCGLNVGDVLSNDQVFTTLQVRREIATNGKPRHLLLSRDVHNAIKDFTQWKKRQGETLASSAPLFCTTRTKKTTRST